MRIKNYIPTYVYPSIYAIDFNQLKKQGIKLCVFDVDNTLVPYNIKIMPTSLMSFLDDLKSQGFSVMILSNNSAKRVRRFLNGYEMAFISRALKPFTRGMNKLLMSIPYKKEEIIMIGDQMKTDIACANKLNIKSVLVKSIDRDGEHWYTRLLRSNEKAIIKKIYIYDQSKGEEINELYQ